eukprot:scaffold579099_cov24-Prasinocladus_malaysianus.AAC.1
MVSIAKTGAISSEHHFNAVICGVIECGLAGCRLLSNVDALLCLYSCAEMQAVVTRELAAT